MFSPFKSGKQGKDANKDSILLSFMMHVIHGFGLVIVLGFPWLKTKADFNLTCYLIGLQKNLHRAWVCSAPCIGAF